MIGMDDNTARQQQTNVAIGGQRGSSGCELKFEKIRQDHEQDTDGGQQQYAADEKRVQHQTKTTDQG